jgi:hypothetical protein
MSLQTERQTRIRQLLEIINGKNPIEKDDLFGLASMKLGISRKTFEDYLVVLRTKNIIVEGTEVRINKEG